VLPKREAHRAALQRWHHENWTSNSLVMADVDGTLVTPDKQAPKDQGRGTQRAEANIAFAITSGRPPRGMRMIVEPLGARTR